MGIVPLLTLERIMYLAAKVECGEIVRCAVGSQADAIKRCKDYMISDGLSEEDIKTFSENMIFEVLEKKICYQVRYCPKL